MFSVEIRSHSYGSGKMPWVDHFGNTIDKLVFSKEYHEEYIPGYYPIESYGSLYRNIDNFRQSPMQSLSEWQIKLPSLYSSKDGQFSTVNLLYYLEYINEKEGKDFNLTGCKTLLFENNSLIFEGVVNSIEDATGNSTVSIGEHIGSPEIKKSDFPITLGNAEILHWPVKITKNEMGQDIIVISERNITKFNGLFIHLESVNKFIRVNFHFNSQELIFSKGYQTAILTMQGSDAAVWILKNDISIDEPFLIRSPNDLIQARGIVDSFRPDINKETPDNYIVGDNVNAEFIQAWASRGTMIDNEFIYELGRASVEQRNYHYSGEKIRKVGVLKMAEIEFGFDHNPISLVENSGNGGLLTINTPFISGSSVSFLEAVSESSESTFNWDKLPRAIHREYFNRTTFTFNFPKLDLSDGYIHRLYCNFKIKMNIDDRHLFSLVLHIGSSRFDLGINSNLSLDGSMSIISFPVQNVSLLDLQKVSLIFDSFINSNEHIFTIGLFTIRLFVRMPLNNAKLYASGEVENLLDSSSENSVIPSIAGLLSAANVDDYNVSKIIPGELNEIKYGSILNNEAVLFRDKLRVLAAESGTLVKHSPIAKEYLVKSTSRQFEYTTQFIPLDIIVLENNIYDFKMESAYRNDILNGILISWGKNFETGKYEHTLTIDFPNDPYRDGEKWDMKDSILGNKWKSIKEQIEKNKTGNIGIVKSIDAEWVMDWDGAEIMAYNYLCWNCAPLRKAQVKCITPLFRVFNLNLDIGDFINIDLPGYPRKFVETAWVITGVHYNLDKTITTFELLEVWDMPVIPADRYLLLEDGRNMLLETGERIKLENINV